MRARNEPGRRVERGPGSWTRLLSVLSLVAGVTTDVAPLLAQDLSIRTEYPGATPFSCGPWEPRLHPTREAAQAARELASDANAALVLGDVERARALLARALEHDDRSSETLYRYARASEDLGDREEAITYFCRALGLPEGDSLPDARARLDALVAADQPDIPLQAVEAFERGVVLVRQNRLDSAAHAFSDAARVAGGWPLATYNVGVVLGRLGDREGAVTHLRSYLLSTPDADNATEVARAVGRLEAPTTRPPPSARSTLVLGLLLPGMGQFYSGRPRAGLSVLGLAGGALVAGLLVRRVTVQCLDEVGAGGGCPPERVVGSSTQRPYLMPSIGVAAAVTVLGAVEALVRRGREPTETPFSELPAPPSRSPSLEGMSGADFVLLSVPVP
jgi:tetratricopeptide (TPR) repeat protein